MSFKQNDTYWDIYLLDTSEGGRKLHTVFALQSNGTFIYVTKSHRLVQQRTPLKTDSAANLHPPLSEPRNAIKFATLSSHFTELCTGASPNTPRKTCLIHLWFLRRPFQDHQRSRRTCNRIRYFALMEILYGRRLFLPDTAPHPKCDETAPTGSPSPLIRSIRRPRGVVLCVGVAFTII
ncbi:hypothetical protein BC826DRAFT_38482 [Russula brevipes]|nr:hypothetical protein BC826DRAFT_38482 [Russula brevipes]